MLCTAFRSAAMPCATFLCFHFNPTTPMLESSNGFTSGRSSRKAETVKRLCLFPISARTRTGQRPQVINSGRVGKPAADRQEYQMTGENLDHLQTEAEYHQAMARLEKIFTTARKGTPEGEEFERLSTLITEWEERKKTT